MPSQTVAVVEQVLAVGVVDQNHREAQRPLRRHRLQADDAGRRLFASAEDVLQLFGQLLVQHAHQIASVVDDDVAVVREHGADVGFVLGLGAAVSGEHLQPALHERGGHVVLRGEGVGAGDVHFRAAGGQHAAEVGRFRLQMHRQRDAQAGERLLRGEFALQRAQQRAVALDPVYFQLARRREGDVFDVAHSFCFLSQNGIFLPL